MSYVGERIRNYWVSIGTNARPGASQETIESFQTKYGISLPKDLYDFYRIVDGMEEGETDDRLFRILPLEAVKPVTEELIQFGGIPDYRKIKDTLPFPNHYFVFGEYMIKLHVYAIGLFSDPSATTPIIWICGSNWRIIAATFSEFVEKYLANPNELLIV